MLLKALVLVHAVPPHETVLPPIKLPVMINAFPIELLMRIALYSTEAVGEKDVVS
jgi:hypothetical protein